MQDALETTAGDGRSHGGTRLVRDGRRVPAGLDEAMIVRVVHAFYGGVRADPLLAPIFEAQIGEDEWAGHLERMCAFWGSMLLGRGGYDGRPLPAHLAIAELDDRHFARWLALFHAVTHAVAGEEAARLFVDRAERVAHSFRLALAFHRGQNTLTIEPMYAATL